MRKTIDYDKLTRDDFPEMDWEKWDEMVIECQTIINNYLEKYREQLTKPKEYNAVVNVKYLYLYNSNGDECYKLRTKQTENVLHVCYTTVAKAKDCKMIIKDYIISTVPLDRETAKNKYRDLLNHGKVYVGHLGNVRNKKIVYTYNSEGKNIGLYESFSQWAKQNQWPLNNSTPATTERIINGLLISYNYYTPKDAKELYSEKMGIY